MRSILSLFLNLVVCHHALAVELIPIDRILGHQLPGTRPLREVDPNSNDVLTWEKRKTSSPYVKVCRALQLPAKEEAIKKAFVVTGPALAALEQAALLLSKNEDPPTTFSADDDVYLVFFTRTSPRYVAIERVEKQAGRIKVSYRQNTHSTANVTTHFGLIPLKSLAVGQHQVVLEQLPTVYDNPDGRVWPEKADDSRVCRPTSFTIVP